MPLEYMYQSTLSSLGGGNGFLRFWSAMEEEWFQGGVELLFGVAGEVDKNKSCFYSYFLAF